MSDLNNCSFTGRLVKDSIFKNVASGLCEFTIAVNGFKPDDVFFMSVALWGKSAEKMQQYLVQGKQVGVTGSLRKNEWKDRDGEVHKDYALNCNGVTLLGSKGDDNGRQRNDEDVPF